MKPFFFFFELKKKILTHLDAPACERLRHPAIIACHKFETFRPSVFFAQPCNFRQTQCRQCQARREHAAAKGGGECAGRQVRASQNPKPNEPVLRNSYSGAVARSESRDQYSRWRGRTRPVRIRMSACQSYVTNTVEILLKRSSRELPFRTRRVRRAVRACSGVISVLAGLRCVRS